MLNFPDIFNPSFCFTSLSLVQNMMSYFGIPYEKYAQWAKLVAVQCLCLLIRLKHIPSLPLLNFCSQLRNCFLTQMIKTFTNSIVDHLRSTFLKILHSGYHQHGWGGTWHCRCGPHRLSSWFNSFMECKFNRVILAFSLFLAHIFQISTIMSNF